MSQKRHSVDQIIAKLHRADVLLGKDTKVPEICKQLGIAEQTDYRWRLKKMVAEQALDMDILKEAVKGNW